MAEPLGQRLGRGSSFVLSLGAEDCGSLQQLVQSAFRWNESEVGQNMTLLFPSQKVSRCQQTQGSPFALPRACRAAAAPPPPAATVVSPFLGLTSLDLLAAAATADASAASLPVAQGAGPATSAHDQLLQQQQQLWQQQVTMQQAQQELMQQQAQQQAAASQAPGSSLQLRNSWQQVTTAMPHHSSSSGGGAGLQPALTAAAAAAAAAQETQATLQLQQLQQQAAAAEEEEGEEQQQDKPAPKRRGRPPKADGQYSQAYLALKRYRARKRDEVEEMEAELAAKLAQVTQLQQENASLRHRQEALQATICIQDKMVEQLSAMQLTNSLRSTTSDTGAAAAAAGGGGGAGSSAAAAAGAAGAAGGGGGTAAEVSALVAAFTGERQDNNIGDSDDDGNDDANDAAANDRASPFVGCMLNTALNNAGAPNPDWAGITAGLDGHAGQAAGAAGAAPFQLPPEVQQLHVPTLLLRYKAFVFEAAAALQALAGALQRQRPAEFPPGRQVPPAAVGRVLPEEAAGMGVLLPASPFQLAEFLALGNDERIPPALPAINLITGQHESIQPEIWQIVASQLSLRPGQQERLGAAWQLYSKSLEQVNEERACLMARLQQALETSDSAAEAAGRGSSSGGGAGNSADGSGRLGTALPAMLNARLMDNLLNSTLYAELSDEIDANMAREDGIMILFDYAIGNMLDDVQRCQVVVSSWPFFPLMGSVCAWLLGVADE